MLSGRLAPSAGRILYRMRDGVMRNVLGQTEAERRLLMRTDWGFVHQNPPEGLRMAVSAGGNVGERLMAIGERHYGRSARRRSIGWSASRSMRIASMTSPAPSQAECASACRSHATWLLARD